MQETAAPVNELAPLVNLGLMHSAAIRAMDRPRHLPGMVAYYGPAGWGKTCAASFVANTLDAHHIQILPFWNRKMFWKELCTELGIRLKKETSISNMGALCCEKLGISQKPLIIDEVDLAIQKGFVDDFRGIYEGSRTAVILIGEESLPDDLQRWERIHSRILEWVPAQPPDLQDAKTLVRMFCRDGITIADDLITDMHMGSGASVRRICVNIEAIHEFAKENGFTQVDRAAWGGRPFYTGDAPPRSNGVVPPRKRGR